MDEIIKITRLKKTFTSRSGEVDPLDDINLTVNKGDIFGIIGLSGGGKSTHVRCMNLLERPTSGSVVFGGKELSSIKRDELLETRRSIGMIFQGFNLLSQRTALKNVCFPLEIAHTDRAAAEKRARELLSLVGLSDRADNYPSQLSGGQKQRVAIARALATEPKVLLCDEATSALDPNTTEQILALLKEINKKLGVTIVVITHEMRVIERICNRVAVIDAGKIVEQGDVSDIFTNPRCDITRELVLPHSADKGTVERMCGRHCLRIVFDGNSSFEPIISNMTLECKTPVNILFADTRDIDGKAFGQMLIQLPEDEAAVERITAFLKSRSIAYREELSDVH